VEFPEQQKEQYYKQKRKRQKEEDQADLEQRWHEIEHILDAPATDGKPEVGKRDRVDRRITDEPVTFDRPPSVVKTVKIRRESNLKSFRQAIMAVPSGTNQSKSGENQSPRGQM
jgi:hypothetical protein